VRAERTVTPLEPGGEHRGTQRDGTRVPALRVFLALSLLLSVGLVTGGAYAYWRHAQATPALPDYLALSDAQRRQWAGEEAGFADALAHISTRIAAHRERMVRAIFADAPDREAIEAERRAIATLQQEQQQHVIAQLLKEARILDASQRARLAELLLREMRPAGPEVERLHRR
jgi:hypothetical protein